MYFARITTGAIAQIATIESMFPAISFPPSGPDAAMRAHLGVLPVVEPSYDPTKQMLVGCTPYIDGSVVRTSTVAALPPPVPPAPVVPVSITNAQARITLMQMPSATAGRTLFQDVDDWAKSQGGAVWQAWEYNNDIFRSGSPLVDTLAATLGMTSAQTDAFFIAAGSVKI